MMTDNSNNNNDSDNNNSSNNNDLYGLGFITSSFEEFDQQGDEMAALGSEPPPEIQRRVRDRIASHPLFPKLLDTYLDCRKVGAPPEIAAELEEIRRDNGEPFVGAVTSDPDLDYFMETYCEILEKYKSDLARPFDEATSFLSEMQAQLNDLISINNPPPASTSYVSGL